MRIAFLILLFSSIAAASPLDTANRAMAARQKMMQADATPADVDAFLAFAADDLVYEDPVVKMRIEGKAQLSAGMKGFLGATRKAKMKTLHTIAVANLVVVEQDVSFEYQDGDRWLPTKRRQVTTLELDAAGKIHRLADYWAR